MARREGEQTLTPSTWHPGRSNVETDVGLSAQGTNTPTMYLAHCTERTIEPKTRNERAPPTTQVVLAKSHA